MASVAASRSMPEQTASGANGRRSGASLIAPANAAFNKVPTPLLGLIGGSKDLLTRILTHHVSAGKGVKTSNGTVWVIDSVLLPQFK